MCAPAIIGVIAPLITSHAAGIASVGSGITLSQVALGATLAATVASTAVQMEGAKAQEQAAKRQAKYEYQVSQYEADVERQKGELEQISHGIASRRAYGTAAARAGKFGSDIGFGTTADQFVELRKFQAFEQNTIARNADTAVTGANVRGQMALLGGKNRATAAKYSSVGAAFSGVAAVGGLALDARALGVGSASATRLTRSSSVSPQRRADL